MDTQKYEVDLLIFDLDGTLVNSLQDIANALNYSLRQLGTSELPLTEIRRHVGEGFKKFLEHAIGNPTEQEIEKGLVFFRQYYAEHICDYSETYPGIAEVLNHFAGKKKAVLTNKPEDFAIPILEILNLKDHFPEVVAGNTGIPLKPEPDGIFLILNRLNSLPERTVIIGDSAHDVLAGRAANVYTCAALYGFQSREIFENLAPDIKINHPLELKNRLI
jgi:phosphoglycolate phosphatase